VAVAYPSADVLLTTHVAKDAFIAALNDIKDMTVILAPGKGIRGWPFIQINVKNLPV